MTVGPLATHTAQTSVACALPDTDTDTSAGMGVWMTLLGGVLAIMAGVLVFMDQE